MGWLSGWAKRKSHVINAAAGAGTLYQVSIKVYKTTGEDGTETANGITMGKVYVGSNCRDDFGDIRFTDDDGALLDCWMETLSSGVSAVFWVEVTDSLTTDPVTIYVYYSKADATYPYLADDDAQGEATFLFFDHFLGSAIDTDKWQGGTADVTVASSIMTHTKASASYLTTKTTYSPAVRYRAYGQVVSAGASEHRNGFDSGDNVNDVSIQYHYSFTAWRRVALKAGVGTIVEMATTKDLNWHIFQIFFISTSSCKFQIDNNAAEETTTNIPIVAVPICSVTSSGNIPFKCDWMMLTKYVSPEPAHSTWGTEENPPSLKAGLSIIPLGEMIFG